MIVPMRNEHIDAVFSDLSRQTIDEAIAAQIPVDKLRDMFGRFMARGPCVVHAYLEDKPLWVMATSELGNHATFFVAADGFFEKSLRHYKLFRRYLAELVHILGGPILTISGSPHPNMARWFAIMGYQEVAVPGIAQKVYRWG